MKNFTFNGGVTKYWWIPLLTGLLSIALGIWCLCCPVESLPVLAYAFAIIFTAAGLFNCLFAVINARVLPAWGWSLAMGILELILGIWMLCLPQAALTATFMWVVGFYILFAVINGICESCSVWNGAFNWIGWLVGLLLITLIFAVVFISGPVVNGIAVWLWIGISFIFFGIYRVAISLGIRKLNRAIRF